MLLLKPSAKPNTCILPFTEWVGKNSNVVTDVQYLPEAALEAELLTSIQVSRDKQTHPFGLLYCVLADHFETNKGLNHLQIEHLTQDVVAVKQQCKPLQRLAERYQLTCYREIAGLPQTFYIFIEEQHRYRSEISYDLGMRLRNELCSILWLWSLIHTSFKWTNHFWK